MNTVFAIALFVCLSLHSAVAKIPHIKGETGVETATHDRWNIPIYGERVNIGIYKTKPFQRAWHGSDHKLDVWDLGIQHVPPIPQLPDLPLWLSTWSTNSLAAGLLKVKQATNPVQGTKLTKESFHGQKVYMHLFQIETPVELINLGPDSEGNRKILSRAAGLNKEGPATMGKPSSDAKGYTKAMCNLPKDDHSPASFGWRSAWDQDEIMLCPKAQGPRGANLKLIKRIECDVWELLVAGAVKDGKKASDDTEVKWDGTYGIKGTHIYKDGGDEKTSPLLGYDLQVNGLDTILDVLGEDKPCQQEYNYKYPVVKGKENKPSEKELLQ